MKKYVIIEQGLLPQDTRQVSQYFDTFAAANKELERRMKLTPNARLSVSSREV